MKPGGQESGKIPQAERSRLVAEKNGVRDWNRGRGLIVRSRQGICNCILRIRRNQK